MKEDTVAVADPGGPIRPWLPSILAINFAPPPPKK